MCDGGTVSQRGVDVFGRPTRWRGRVAVSRESRGARPLVSSQPPTVAGSPAYGREPSQVSQTSTLRVWEANGGMAYNSALSEVSFSASNVFPSAAFTAGSSARSVDNAALPPIEDGNATYPA